MTLRHCLESMTVREVRLWDQYYDEVDRRQLEEPGITESYLMQITQHIDLIRMSLGGSKSPPPELSAYKLTRKVSKPKPKQTVEEKTAISKSMWALRLGGVPEDS